MKVKKLFIVVTAFLLAPYFCAAQNSFPSSGNVGVGTNTPTAALQVVRGGTNSGADYPVVHILTNGSGNIYGPILYLNGLSGTGGKNWGLVSSGALDAGATGAAGNFAIYDAGAGSRLVINSSGNVGIGTLNPTTGLLVAQGLITSQTATNLNPGNNDAFNLFAGGGGYADGARHSILWSQLGLMLARFGTEYNAARGQVDFIWRDQYNYGPSQLESMRLTAGGNLGIGTSAPDAKLAVNGTVHAKEVKVDLVGWPDYVFRPAYRLPPLAEVKRYIDENRHLPEVPSEKEVSENGVNLGEMNKLLMKKVEELTLYLLEKDSQLTDQGEKMKLQGQKLERLEKQVKKMAVKLNQASKL